MRGIGFQDSGQTVPLPNDAMFRIASVTKPITAAAIRHLIGTGALSLSDAIFDVGQSGGGILNSAPFPSLGDRRLDDITVEHLLLHQGGWDRDLLGLDLTFLELSIASDMGIESPPSRIDPVRWIMGQPLQFAPGTQTVYSNISFLLLGLSWSK